MGTGQSGHGSKDKHLSVPEYKIDHCWILIFFRFWHVYVLWLGVYWWKRDVRATHDMTSERHTTWCQSNTRRDIRALHDVTSHMSHERHDFVTWLLHANMHPASRISQYDNSHPVQCFWILLEFRNTIVRVRSRVSRYDNWTLIGLRCFWILRGFRNTIVRVSGHV
jgi:hypothetical protein